MRAVTQDSYGEADVLRVTDIPRPDIADDQLLVRVHAAGVDPGVWHLMTGRPYLVRALGFGLRRPKVPVRGRDCAGVVEAVGAKVTRFQVGEEVYGTTDTGSFAEYTAAPEKLLATKPSRLTFAEAAVAPISGVSALQAVRDAGRVRAGQQVMVIGAAGGVGSFAVQIATAMGASVTGVASGGKEELVRSLGATEFIDYARDEVSSNGPRYDVIIDTAGNRPLSVLRRAMTPKGSLVIVGGESTGGRLMGGFQRQLLLAPVASLFSSQRLVPFAAKERWEDLVALAELIDTGAVTPALSDTYELNQAPEAIRYVASGHARGKVAVTV
jgi:NADPH:quinone reductase-like Zn-dependent oxidoreductase